MKKFLIILLLVSIGLVSGWYLTSNNTTKTLPAPTASTEDPLNATYTLEEKKITFKDGVFEWSPDPKSSTVLYTKIVEPVFKTDVDADGDTDYIVRFVDWGGGTGVFDYMAVALSYDGKLLGTNSVFLGDRITFDKVLVENNEIVVSYFDRKADEPKVAEPTVFTTKKLRIENGKIVEVEPQAPTPAVDTAFQCKASGGEWNVAYKECGGISQNQCEDIGGRWNECASACRHNPEVQICTLQCVLVCEFK